MDTYLVYAMISAIVIAIGIWVKFLTVVRVMGIEGQTAELYLLWLHILLTVGFLCGLAISIKEYFFTAPYVTWLALAGATGATFSLVFNMTLALVRVVAAHRLTPRRRAF